MKETNASAPIPSPENQTTDPEVSVPLTIPVIEESLQLDTQSVETGNVRIVKKVHETEVQVDTSVVQENVEVERVAINAYVEDIPTVRYEGETMIIPVLREELVTVKRLVLVEELHIKRNRTETPDLQTVTLRSEEVVIERETVPPTTTHPSEQAPE